eukprot:SAG11_NODE_1283_length_5306_cov_3.174957_3_plen_566_part_00
MESDCCPTVSVAVRVFSDRRGDRLSRTAPATKSHCGSERKASGALIPARPNSMSLREKLFGRRPWTHQGLGPLDWLNEAIGLSEDYCAMFMITDDHDPTLLYCAFFFFPIVDSIIKLMSEMSPWAGDDLVANVLSEVFQCWLFMHFADYEMPALLLFPIFGAVQILIILYQFCTDDDNRFLDCSGGCSVTNVQPMSVLSCCYGNITAFATEINILVLVAFFSSYAPWFTLEFEIPFVFYCWFQGSSFGESMQQLNSANFGENSVLQSAAKVYEKVYSVYMSVLVILYIDDAADLLCTVATPTASLKVNKWTSPDEPALACGCSGTEPLIMGLAALIFCLSGCAYGFMNYKQHGEDCAASSKGVFVLCFLIVGLVFLSFWIACLSQDSPQENEFSITFMVLSIIGCCVGFGKFCFQCCNPMGERQDTIIAGVSFLIVAGIIVVAALQIDAVHTDDVPFISDCDVVPTYPHAPTDASGSGADASGSGPGSTPDVDEPELDAYISREDAAKYLDIDGYKFLECGKDSFDYYYSIIATVIFGLNILEPLFKGAMKKRSSAKTVDQDVGW